MCFFKIVVCMQDEPDTFTYTECRSEAHGGVGGADMTFRCRDQRRTTTPVTRIERCGDRCLTLPNQQGSSQRSPVQRSGGTRWARLQQFADKRRRKAAELLASRFNPSR